MNIDANEEFCREDLSFYRKTVVQAGIHGGLIIKEVKTTMRVQSVIISEGRSVMAAVEDCSQTQQIGTIIKQLELELQRFTERLEELITSYNNAAV